MELSVVPVAQDVVCLSLNGRLDTPGVDRIETHFTAAAVSGGEHAIVDLGEVSFISSMGVRLLLSAARAMQQRGRRMVLFGAQPLVLETLDNVAIDELIPLKDSRNAALSAALAA
jgi:anti-sigma B factor antagonist